MVFGGVGVGGTDVGAAVGRAADDDRAVDQAAGHVADVGGVVEDLVEGDRVEADQNISSMTGRTPSMEAPTPMPMKPASLIGVSTMRLGPYFGQQAFGDFVGTVELGDFFAHDDDVGVAFDFLGEGVAEGFAVGDDEAW